MRASAVECLRLASRQHGVLTRRQATERGLSAKQVCGRLSRGEWSRIYPSVFRVEGAPLTWRQTLKGASLWAERGYALSHTTAGELWGFPAFRGLGAVELSTTRRLRDPNVVTHHVDVLDPRDIASRECFRVTSVGRTLLDLAAALDAQQTRELVEDALRRKLTTVDRLEQLLARNSGARGVHVLRALVWEFSGGDGPTESVLERRVEDLVLSAGLPAPRRQRTVLAGKRVRRLDFVFPEAKVIVEADGYAWHSTPEAFEKDRERRNALTRRGYIVLQWTWRALEERPGELLAELAEVLARRS